MSRQNSLIFLDAFGEMLLISPWFSLMLLLFLSTYVGTGRALTLRFAVQP